MTEPISLSALFAVSKAGVDISVKIAKALKLIESIESKLDLLMQVEFNAAWKTLVEACNSSSCDQQQSVLINYARAGFTKATCIEKGERLLYAHLGLAICYYLLKDLNNVRTALIGVTKISVYKEVYQQETNLRFGFNKYIFNNLINSYNPKSILNLLKFILAYKLVLAQKIEIQKYNKFPSNSFSDILRKINAEEQIIAMVTKANQPSLVFEDLQGKSLNLINLQKESLKIANNI